MKYAIVNYTEWSGHHKYLEPNHLTGPAIIKEGFAFCGVNRTRKRVSAGTFEIVEYLEKREYQNAIRRLRYAKKAEKKAAEKKALEVKLSKNGKVLYKVGSANKGVFEVPDGVEKIKKGAFDALWKLTEILFPATLKEVEDGAFFNLPSLEKVTLPAGIKITPAAFGPNCGDAGRAARKLIRSKLHA